MKFQIDGEHLTLEQLYAAVFDHAEVELSAGASERMNASRAVIERLIDSNTAVYGVNTGFGKMASVRISREQIRQLQVNLVRSHACGVGAPLNESETRAMLVLRANAIAKGFSGVRPVVAETLCAMLNRGVHPVIPSQGSVGASGDLAPLAHLAQVAIGEGHAIYGRPQGPRRRSDAQRWNRAARARGQGRSCAAKRNAGDACLAGSRAARSGNGRQYSRRCHRALARCAARQSCSFRCANRERSPAPWSRDNGAKPRAAESRKPDSRIASLGRKGSARPGPVQPSLRAAGAWRRA